MKVYVCSRHELEFLHKQISSEKYEIGYILLSEESQPDFINLKPYMKIDCLDVEQGKDGYITTYQIDGLYTFINTYWFMDIMIVMCDAGLSRSPAVAMVIKEYFNDWKEEKEMKEIYKWYNKDMYKDIKSRFQYLDIRKEVE